MTAWMSSTPACASEPSKPSDASMAILAASPPLLNASSDVGTDLASGSHDHDEVPAHDGSQVIHGEDIRGIGCSHHRCAVIVGDDDHIVMACCRLGNSAGLGEIDPDRVEVDELRVPSPRAIPHIRSASVTRSFAVRIRAMLCPVRECSSRTPSISSNETLSPSTSAFASGGKRLVLVGMSRMPASYRCSSPCFTS